MCPPNIPSSVPPPPPPPSSNPSKNNGTSDKPFGSIISKSNPPKNPVQLPPCDVKASPLFQKMQKKNNTNSATVDNRDFIGNNEQHGGGDIPKVLQEKRLEYSW